MQLNERDILLLKAVHLTPFSTERRGKWNILDKIMLEGSFCNMCQPFSLLRNKVKFQPTCFGEKLP